MATYRLNVLVATYTASPYHIKFLGLDTGRIYSPAHLLHCIKSLQFSVGIIIQGQGLNFNLFTSKLNLQTEYYFDFWKV